MIVFVEHDADGNLVHICQVETTEGHAVEQETPLTDDQVDAMVAAAADGGKGPTSAAARQTARQAFRDARRVDRQARAQAAIAAREAETRAQLAQAPTALAGLIVLPEGSDRPEHHTHKVKGGKVVTMTAAERKAWRDARAAERAATPPAAPS